MTRKVITRDKLLGMINDKMASLEACRNLSLGIAFDTERTHGGNWTTSGLHRSGADHDQGGCSVAIAKFLAELQESYDISGE